jgi:PBSX family phage terminase large subunit
MIEKMYTPKQWEVVQDIQAKKPRQVILEGAIRSGKTYLGILFWNAIISRYTKKLFIMTGQTISSLKRNVLDDIEKLFGVNTHLNINNEFEYYGNKVACFGTDKADSFKSMRGLTAQAWYANEVILSHQNSVLEAFSRCSEPGARIIWETNPDKPTHYIKTSYIDRSGSRLDDGSYNVMSYHFELEDNTFLDKNFIESIKQSIPSGTIYDRQVRGLWKATDRAVYDNYQIVAMDPPESKIQDVFYGLDFGYNNPTALVKVMRTDEGLYLRGLLHRSQMITSEIVEQIGQMIFDKNRPIYCDTAEPDKIRAIQDAGYNAMPARKEVAEGILKVKEYRLYIVNDDIDLVRSFENYEYRKNAGGEILEDPVKLDDHYPDAVRYAIATHEDLKIKNEFYICGDADDAITRW